VFLQINTVKYNADWEITNIHKNLQIVDLGLPLISIGLLVFGFVANEYKWIAIQLLLTIHNIWSAIQLMIIKVILDYSPLPTHFSSPSIPSHSFALK
jgi:hypothetical protein